MTVPFDAVVLMLVIMLLAAREAWLRVAVEGGGYCRVGDRRDERGRHGVKFEVREDGHPTHTVIGRERVRRTRPDASQEFFYFSLPRRLVRSLGNVDLAYVVLEYLVLDPVSVPPRAPAVVLEYDIVGAPGARLSAFGKEGSEWRTVAFPLVRPAFQAQTPAGFSLAGSGAHFRVSAELDRRKVSLALRSVIVAAFP